MNLWQDVQFSLRSMRKSLRITLTVLATLALGIGANTAIFSIVNAALLKPLPFHQAEQLVELNADLRGVGAKDVGFSVLEFEDLRDRSGIFSAASVVWLNPVNLTGGDHPERLEFLAMSPNYSNVLGAQPQMGRLFNASDVTDGFSQSAVISDSLWHREFGGDRGVLGRGVRLDNDLYTIVGVLPAEFHPPMPPGSAPVDMVLTTGFRALPFPAKPMRNQRFLPSIIARLKPGMSLKQAQAELEIFTNSERREYGGDYPASAGWALTMTPLKDVVAGSARTLLISLLIAVGLILLIACVNVANLLLVKASSREREIALRMALGATRARIVRQMLVESALLSLIAAVVGAGAAALGLRVLIAALPSQLPRLNPIGVDLRVLAFSLVVALVTTILFGLMPALQAAKTQPGTADLRERSGSVSRHAAILGKSLIGAEVALSLMLLVAAGLLLRTFWNLLEVDPGFKAQHLVAGSFWLPYPNDPTTDIYHKPEQRVTLIREILRRLRTIPGVESTAMTSVVPLEGSVIPIGIRVEDAPAQGDTPTAVLSSVTPDFFQTMGMPLLRGRAIEESDDIGSPFVVVVDQAAAHHFWGDGNPIGRRIAAARNVFDANGGQRRAPWGAVVGVVGNARLSSLDETDVPHVYISMYQFSDREYGVLVRATGDKATLTHAIDRQIRTVDPNLPISDISQMTQLMSDGVVDRRFAAWLLGAFALVALLLTSVGVYGVSSYAIVRREKEIGIRSALGATPGNLVLMILRDGMVPVVAGLAVGGVAAVLSGRLLGALLFNVTSVDALVYASAGFTLILIGILANYLPARRAGRIDPIVALRND